MGSSDSPSPGGQSKRLCGFTTLGTCVYGIRFYDPEAKTAISVVAKCLLNAKYLRITRDEDPSRWCLKGFKAPRLQADAPTIQVNTQLFTPKIRLSAHSVRAKDQCRVVTFQD